MECRICGNKNGNKIYAAREMMFGFHDEFYYFECAACGCLQIKEIPADMSKYYPEDYYSISAKPPEHRFIKDNLVNMRDDFTVLGKSFIGRMLFSLFPAEDLRPLSACQLTKKSCILDVGCGTGLLLHRLKNAGFENVMGADPYIKNDI
ncbi:MAG: class I SAM-dependent methyltransferase, partial [Candidatus Omnitrophota bacterium]|nr:class I SAM-dependent methyltransferase [Candidatus Omnitrophota bacterium]